MNIKSLMPKGSFEHRLYLATTLLISFGLVSSITYGNWQNFERSGSLLVILAILSFSQHKIDEIREYAEKNQKKLAKKMESSDSLEEEEKEILEFRLGFQGFLLSKLPEIKTRWLYCEVCIAVLGTFIWGYGSYLGFIFKL